MEIEDLAIIGVLGGFGFLLWRQSQGPAAIPGGIPTPPLPPPGAYTPPPSIAPPPSPAGGTGTIVDWNPASVPSVPGPVMQDPGPIGQGRAVAVSASGKAFIKGQEGLRLTAYPDGGKVSIGYGHQIQPGETIGRTITAATADQLFEGDISRVQNTLNQLVTVQLSQSEYDAIASLAYNIGTGAFAASTLLKKLNARDFTGARGEFGRWVYSSGNVTPALVARRAKEAALFGAGWAIA